MPWPPQFIIQSANVKHLRANEKDADADPEDALHEILIKLAPHTLYFLTVWTDDDAAPLAY